MDGQTSPPLELEDAHIRIAQAIEHYNRLVGEIRRFHYEFVRGMIKERDPDTGDFNVQVRPPSDSYLRGKPNASANQIAENLLAALDYVVFELSRHNSPDLREETPQFVIAKSPKLFAAQAKNRLRYLSSEHRSFIEEVQPYKKGKILAVLEQVGNPGKHRHLLTLVDCTGLEITLSDMSRIQEHKNSFVYPYDDGAAIFARPTGNPRIVLLDKYDALPTFEAIIESVRIIVSASARFFITGK